MTDKEIENIIKKATPECEREDYIKNGLLYCGKCHTPKEFISDLTASGLGVRKLPTFCKCRAEQEKQRKAEQERKARAEYIAKLRREGLPEGAETHVFRTCKVNKENERVLKIGTLYAKQFDEMYQRNQGLLLYGNVGSGKTYLAHCIANALIDTGVPVIATSFIKLIHRAQNFGYDIDDEMERLNQAKLLVIDDLGSERGTDYALEQVYSIVDSRYRQRQPMIITTNMPLRDMKVTTDVRYERIYDRIFEACYPVQFVGQSFRKQIARTRYEEMQSILEGRKLCE